jgi:hypothetical protein
MERENSLRGEDLLDAIQAAFRVESSDVTGYDIP